MSTKPDQQQGPFAALWEAVGHFGNLQTVWGFAAAFLSTAVYQSSHAGTPLPPHFWAMSGAVFFGTWTAAILINKAGLQLAHRFRRRPRLNTVAHGGGVASIAVTNTGGTGEIVGEAQVLSVKGGDHLVQYPYRLHWHDHSGRDSIVLAKGDHGVIWLAINEGQAGNLTLAGGTSGLLPGGSWRFDPTNEASPKIELAVRFFCEFELLDEERYTVWVERKSNIVTIERKAGA